MKTKLSRRTRIAALFLIVAAVLSLGSCDLLLELLGGDTPGQVPNVTPTNLRATTTTATAVTLAWDIVTLATGYRVYRAVGTGAFSKIGEVTSPTYTDATVTSSSAYKYTVSAFNTYGEGPQTTPITVSTPATGAETSAAAVTTGIALLSQDPPDLDGAKTQFAAAVIADPANPQAVLWNAAMTLGSKMVSAEMQTLATDYIGIVDYPADLNTLFLPGSAGYPAWLGLTIQTGTSTYYNYVGTGMGSYSGTLAYVGSGLGDYDSAGYYVGYHNGSYNWQYAYVGPGNGSYNQVVSTQTAALPLIAIPAGIMNMDTAGLTMSKYFMALAFNIISKNSNGFNALVDQVVDQILGPALDQAAASLTGIPDAASIEITWDMFTNNPANWPQANGGPITFRFGKAEFLALSAYLQAVKSVALMGKSVSLSFPAQQYWDAMNPVDHAAFYSGTTFPTAAFLAALYALPTPFSAGFLGARADAAATLGSAKTAYLAALGNLDAACSQLLSRTTTSTFTLSPASPVADIAANWNTAKNAMRFARILITKTQASITDGTPLIVPTGFPTYITSSGFDGNTFFQVYSAAGSWPTAADEGPYYSTSGTTTTFEPPTAVAVNLRPMFTTPLFALNSLFEMDAAGEPVWYPFDVTFTISSLQNSSANPPVNFNYMPTDVAPPVLNPYVAVSSMNSTQLILESEGTSLRSKTATGSYQFRLYAPRVKDLTFGGTFPVSPTMFANLKQTAYTAITSGGGSFNMAILDNLFRQAADGSISAYLPTIPAFVAYNSFVAAGQDLTLDIKGTPMDSTDDLSYSTKGSYWWAMPTDYMYCGTLFGGAY